jgi:hypothetical protein
VAPSLTAPGAHGRSWGQTGGTINLATAAALDPMLIFALRKQTGERDPRGAMVSVEIAPDDGRSDGGRPRRADRKGVIEIDFGCGARVRLRGEVSRETLRQVIELLR